jgi:seryl-tRNA synthetase
MKERKVRERIHKRKMYADQIKKLVDIKVSDHKRQQILNVIQEENKHPSQKVPRVKRKTGGYYSIKFVKK